MQFIGIDLGSTNTKAAIYDDNFKCLASESEPVLYERSESIVEFDADLYYKSLAAALKRLAERPEVKVDEVQRITLTGQAETLIVLDKEGKPLMNAISWMDERSRSECEELAEQFTAEECELVTGQQAVLPTWPATKILWLKRNKPEVYENAATYMLLKDYVVYRLTGKMLSDCSIATFSFYFDIYKKCYWKKMMDAIGITESQLPKLVEPCTDVCGLNEETASLTGFPQSLIVNVGTLDHFAGMIGTGNIAPGGVSMSTGTVMALATFASEEMNGKCTGIAMHYGFVPDTRIILTVAESGGASLEWFKKNCMPNINYDMMNEELAKRKLPSSLIFLPYLVGTNSPEFDAEANGLFYGLRAEHDAIDMAGAVMEGVAHLLRKNCEAIRATGTNIDYIIATGGGAKSPIWCQMQADLTGLPVVIPAEKEAACLGAALAGAVAAGVFASYAEASEKIIRMEKRYEPQQTAAYEKKYAQFNVLYKAMLEVARMK